MKEVLGKFGLSYYGLLLFLVLSLLTSTTFSQNDFYGICYGPFRQGQSPRGLYPSYEELEEDIQIINEHASFVRTYGIDNSLAYIVQLCEVYNLPIYLGVWISGEEATDQNTIADLIQITEQYSSVVKAVIVGNEYVYHNFHSGIEPVEYIMGIANQVQELTDIPVTIAEPWDIWFVYPQLATSVDFISVHIYSFFRGISVNSAAQDVINVYNAVKNKYSDQEVIILEVGWPTDGTIHGDAVPSEENQEQFLKDLILLTRQNSINAFAFEFADEPWKGVDIEGNWGLFYEDRTPKSSTRNITSNDKADINFDGVVNLLDYLYVANRWQEHTDPNNVCLPGDINQDGNVNIKDLQIFVESWLYGY